MFSNISILQKNRKFYVTALIIPKQESTSDSVWKSHAHFTGLFFVTAINYTSTAVILNLYFLFYQCQTTNEEEIFDVQDKQSLFPLGWIHVSIL
jgi:STAM-binding protein